MIPYCSYKLAPTASAALPSRSIAQPFRGCVSQWMVLVLLMSSPFSLPAQDVMHFVDGHQEAAKVLEVGTDTIRYVMGTSRTSHREVARYRVSHITYENGQTYFVPPTRIYLNDGKIVTVHVQQTDDKHIKYIDLYTNQERKVAIKKVAVVGYEDGTRKYYNDKINLRNGGFVAGRVLEVSDATVIFENAARQYREQTLALDNILSIEFINGFEQQFLSSQRLPDSAKDDYEN